MRKRVFLLAVSCKSGGLCPGGIDLDNPKEWIRIVRDDGQAGAVQGHEIDFAQPLDVIEFDGRPMPQGKQKENWVIDNHSCRKIGTEPMKRVLQAFREYGYHGFWNNGRPEFQQMIKDSDKKLFDKAEDDYLLTTKLFCGCCGALMFGESGTSRTGEVHRYYKCATAKKHKGCKNRVG